MVKMEIISKVSIKPSSPTPNNLRTFRLSLLDQLFPPSFRVPLVLYYSHDESASHVKQAEISSVLKRSLSDALSLYYPFAGRMKDESSVDCSDQGIDYLEARVDTRLSEIIEQPKVEVIDQFIPSTSEGVLLGIQLNYFSCGGIAIGVSICHTVTDGCTLSMFLKAWAAMARGDTNMVAPSFIMPSLFPSGGARISNPGGPISHRHLIAPLIPTRRLEWPSHGWHYGKTTNILPRSLKKIGYNNCQISFAIASLTAM